MSFYWAATARQPAPPGPPPNAGCPRRETSAAGTRLAGSHGPEGFGGGQPGGAGGGQQPGEGADDDGRGETAGPGLGRDDHGLAAAAGVCADSSRTDGDSGGSADQR